MVDEKSSGTSLDPGVSFMDPGLILDLKELQQHFLSPVLS